MAKNELNIAVSERELWLIQQIRNVETDSRSVTVRFTDHSPSHVFVERQIKTSRRITDIVKDAPYQVLTIDVFNSRITRISQRISRKLERPE